MKKLFTILLMVGLVIAGSVPSFSQSNSQALKIERMDFSSNSVNTSALTPVNTQEQDQIFNQNVGPRAIITALPNNGGTSQNSRAPSSGFRYQRTYYYITAAEMAASGYTGTINSIGFNYSAAFVSSGTFTVWFQNAATFVDKGTNWNAAIAPMTMAGSGTLNLPGTIGTVDFALSPGFAYTTGQGLWVAWQWSNPAGTLLGFNTALCNTNQPAPILRNSQANDSLRVLQTSSSNFRPETRLGNASVDAISMGPVYSLGEAAICPCPDTNLLIVNMFHLENVLDTVIITTTIKNVVGGATKYQYIDTIISNAVERWVIFYLYPKGSEVCKRDSIITTGRVKRSEGVTANNRATYLKKSTLNRWNQAEYTGLLDGGVGFTGGTGDFVAGFYTSCTIPINAVDLSFFTTTGGNQPFNVKIFASDNDTLKPGALLFTSAGLTSPPASPNPARMTYNLPSPVNVGPGYYFVGIAQTATTNIAFGFQNENPIRFETFFYASPVGTTSWVDFADAGANFRLDIAPKSSISLQLKAFVEGFYQGNGNTVRDTLTLRVRSAATKQIVQTSKAYMSSTGVGSFKLWNVNCDSSYYYDVTSRCAVATWSNQTQKFDVCNKQYVFSDAINKAFGNNMVQYPNDAAPTFAFYTGDPNQDQCVDATDVSLVDNDAFNFVSGYVPTDVNGDGFVDAADLGLTDNNAFNFVCSIHP